MKKILFSLFSTNLLIFSSNFVYACNTIKKDQNEEKKDDATTSIVTKDYEIYDQNLINEPYNKTRKKPALDSAQENELNQLSANEKLEPEQTLKNYPSNLSKDINERKKDNVLDTQQSAVSDPFTLLSQIT